MATLEQQKSYLFVHEADEAKGGAPIEMLAAELQDETQCRDLFDGRRITTWHRVKEFQLVSLLQIAQDMLKDRQQEVSLYIPGSLSAQKLVFPAPVTLYASPNNPGAAEAVVEMTSMFANVHLTERKSFGVGGKSQTSERARTYGRMLKHPLSVSAVVVQSESARAGDLQVTAQEAGRGSTHFVST